MKKTFTLLLTLLALQSWGFEVTYDYTTPAKLKALGFTESEFQASSEGLIPMIRNKVLTDEYATMTYQHFCFYYVSGECYILQFLNASNSNSEWGENWCGQLIYATNIGYHITKVVVESSTPIAAGRLNVTLGNATSTTSGATTTCNYPDGSRTMTLSGEATAIKTITVTYESYNIYDVNDDGKVDPDDMNEMLKCWLVTQDWYNPNFDLDSNGVVDVADVDMLLTHLQSNPMNMDITPYIGWGDVNGNGVINARDYNLIRDFAMEYENANNGWACNNADYDLNDDGKCDFWDYFIVYFLVQQGYTTPAHSGNIVFEDASTKAACVSCFDLNGDGELSYREADRVKASQLQDIAGNSGVVHFDEFQYFTGITELPDDCFMQWGSLRTITLPDGLKKVSRMAFIECYNLERVTLPEGIKSIEYGAFHCANTDETALTTINFPSTLTYIGDYAFGNCGKLANIEFAENSSLEHIGRYAFGGCLALTSFNFESVQRIDGHAFAGTGLTEVNTSADNIGRQAFYTNHPITVNVLRDYMNFYDNDDDSYWGLHLPITNPSVSGTKVLVNRAIFSKAYNATTTARDQLHPYIKLRPYTYESDDNEATPFACEVPVVLPVGSKIFIVTGLETGKALSRLIPGRVVPANTGVIVKLPGRVLDQTQVWQLTADPTATSDADFSDNILQAAVDGVDVNSNNQCFEWVTFFRDNHCSYGFQTNMDAVNFGGCYAFLNVPISQLPSGSTPYSFGDFYEMYLTVPEVNGDVNGDELTDVTDVNIVINIILGKAQAADYPGSADLNNDNEVDVSDVNTMVNIILGKTPTMNTYTVNGVSFKMVDVTGGTFNMGGTEEQGSDVENPEKPVHPVTLSNFSIGQTEVTQELWQAVMGTNPSNHLGDLQRPVEKVSWNDCQTFITKLNQLTGLNFRLPTEAEWEYAARGGNKSQGYKYAGSNNIDDVAWYRENAQAVGSSSPDYGTHPVATKAANELGLYDMSGNVVEWCQDWYKNNYYSGLSTDVPTVDPTGPDSGSSRVTRGGSWDNTAQSCRVSSRNGGTPTSGVLIIGLRLAL